MSDKYNQLRELIISWMNVPGDYDEKMWPEVQKILEQGRIMDKKIKSAKKVMDKKMDSLVKADIKRDKACDSKMKMKKK